MVRADSPDLVGDIAHRGDRTGGPPPAGMPAAPGTWQGGAVNPASGLLTARPDLLGDIGRRGDLSGRGTGKPPADLYGTRRGRDLKSSWDWLQFCASLPADPLPLSGALAGQILSSGRHILMGGSIVNNTSTAGSVNIYDGFDVGGTLIANVPVAASSSSPLNLPASGVLIEQAVFVKDTGTIVNGSLWVVHLWKYPFTPPGE